MKNQGDYLAETREDLLRKCTLKQLKQIAKEKKVKIEYNEFWQSGPLKEDYIDSLYDSSKVTKSYIKKILAGKAKGRMPAGKKIKRKRWSRTVEKAIYEKYNHRCAICKRYTEFGDGDIDHKKSLYLGGSDTVGNLQWLCTRCNRLKGGKLTNAQVRQLLKKASTPKTTRKKTTKQKATRTTRKKPTKRKTTTKKRTARKKKQLNM